MGLRGAAARRPVGFERTARTPGGAVRAGSTARRAAARRLSAEAGASARSQLRFKRANSR